ncbi:MAG: hypothetical protein QNJ64_01185 [Crocosphaera sp.]|nr:hypothetical protein [Crocosphaera sp.]
MNRLDSHQFDDENFVNSNADNLLLRRCGQFFGWSKFLGFDFICSFFYLTSVVVRSKTQGVIGISQRERLSERPCSEPDGFRYQPIVTKNIV